MTEIDTRAPGYGSSGFSSDYNLPGIGPVPVNQREKTSTEMVEEYKKQLTIIEEIMKKEKFTEEDVKKIQDAVNALADLATKGETSTSPPSYMQPEMLEALNPILLLLSNAGITAYGKPDSKLAIAGLESLHKYEYKAENGQTITFATLLSDAISLSSDKSLTYMLETDFILAWNAKFDQELSELGEAMKTTKEIGDTLAKIQELRNRLISAGKEAPDWTDDPQPITPEVTCTMDDVLELSSLAKELEKEIEKLKAAPPAGLGIPDEEGTLTHDLQGVLDDISWTLAIPDNLDQLTKQLTDGTLPPKTRCSWEALMQPGITKGVDSKAWSADREAIYKWAGLPVPTKNQFGEVVSYPWLYNEFFNPAIDKVNSANQQWLTAAGIDTKGMSSEQMFAAVQTARDSSAKTNDPFGYLTQMENWLMDGQGKTGSASGEYQSQLDKAVASCTSLNETQRQDLEALQATIQQVNDLSIALLDAIDKAIRAGAGKLS